LLDKAGFKRDRALVNHFTTQRLGGYAIYGLPPITRSSGRNESGNPTSL
jgi:hypothetical protein